MAKKTKSIHLKSQHGKLPQVVKVCGCCWLKPKSDKSVANQTQQNQLRIVRIAHVVRIAYIACISRIANIAHIVPIVHIMVNCAHYGPVSSVPIMAHCARHSPLFLFLSLRRLRSDLTAVADPS